MEEAKKTSIDLKLFKFPELSDADMAFSCVRTDPALLNEAKLRGFYCGSTKYNELFSKLFFSGGKINFKNDIPAEFKEKATKYLRAFMSSFDPKHEEKDAICALLLSELVVA